MGGSIILALLVVMAVVRRDALGNWHDEEASWMEQEIDGEAGVIPARYRHCDFLLATGGKSQIASLIIGSNDLRSSGL